MGSQDILCGCLCECVCYNEAQRPSGVATRTRRRRCVKRYATAKPGSHSDTPRPFLVGAGNRAKQSLARNRQKVRLQAPHEGPQKQLARDKTAECDVVRCPRWPLCGGQRFIRRALLRRSWASDGQLPTPRHGQRGPSLSPRSSVESANWCARIDKEDQTNELRETHHAFLACDTGAPPNSTESASVRSPRAAQVRTGAVVPAWKGNRFHGSAARRTRIKQR